MGFRTVYGNTVSEDGWKMVDTGSCVWSTIPGTNVNIQLRQGVPSTIMLAFAAEFNKRIEPLRDTDTAGWTLTNSVGTSNHLSGTAMDLNWDSHPFHVPGTFNNKLPELRRLLDEFEGTIFWGGDWSNPIDEMHFQMGFPEGDERSTDFANRLTGGNPAPAVEVSSLSGTDANAAAIISEGRRRGITDEGIRIALATALVESGLRMYANSSVPESLSILHDAVGSDHDSLGLFQQRCPMWGSADVLMNPALSAGLFYAQLVKLDYNGPDSPGSYAQAVQRSAFPDRYDEHYADASALFDRLAGAATVTVSSTTSSGVFMALTDAEQRELLELARQQSGYRRVSRSPLRHVGEGASDTATGFDLNVDGSVHVLLVQALAKLGDPDSLNLLREVANCDPARYADRTHDRLLAQAILNEISQSAPVGTAPATGVTPGVTATPVVEYAPAPQVEVIAASPVTASVSSIPATGLYGELIGLRNQIRDITSTVNTITEGN